MKSRPRLVVALDLDDAVVARRLADQLRGQVDVLKIGLQLFAAAGPALVREFVKREWQVFLDLKVHDIPATAARTVEVACDLGVELLTVHVSGGRRMLEAAVGARTEARPKLVGVTLLTSLSGSDLTTMGWAGTAASVVDRLGRIAHDVGCDGVVASPLEVAEIKHSFGSDFLVVTPGIRPAGQATQDQVRTTTASAAVVAGADYLVVGRPIVQAQDPAAAAAALLLEIEAATERE